MYALVCPCASHEARLSWVVGIGFGYGLGSNEGAEEVSLDCFQVVVDLKSVVASAGIPYEYSNFALRPTLFGRDLGFPLSPPGNWMFM